MNTASSSHFDRQYQRHLKHLKLKGLQPKTIEAYSRAAQLAGKDEATACGIIFQKGNRWERPEFRVTSLGGARVVPYTLDRWD